MRGALEHGRFIDERAARLSDAGGIETQIGQQLAAFGVLDETVGDAQSANVGGMGVRRLCRIWRTAAGIACAQPVTAFSR